MKLSTLSAVVGLGLISMSLLFIQSSASYSANQPASQGTPASGRVIIPAAALPPFDPAATRITETDGTLIVLLETGDTRQDLHILPQRAERNVTAVQVFHANHGQLMSLRLDQSCRDIVGEPFFDSNGRLTEPASSHGGKPGCRRYAA